jgi:hypothetical protein
MQSVSVPDEAYHEEEDYLCNAQGLIHQEFHIDFFYELNDIRKTHCMDQYQEVYFHYAEDPGKGYSVTGALNSLHQDLMGNMLDPEY